MAVIAAQKASWVCSAQATPPRDRNDRERADSLCAVNQHTFDVGRRRWTAHQHRIVRSEELGPVIRVVQVADDVGRIEQGHEVLGQVAQGVDLVLRFAEPDRPGLGNREQRTHDAHVDVVQVVRVADCFDAPRAIHLGHGRTDHLRVRKPGPDQRVDVSVGGHLRPDAAHQGQGFDELVARRWQAGIEHRHVGQHGRRALRGAQACEYVLSAAHFSFLSRYQSRKVCSGASGTSRCSPHALKGL
jgi:hypothetical protein